MKVYVVSYDYYEMLEVVGVFINDRLLDIEGIERSMTTMTFKVF